MKGGAGQYETLGVDARKGAYGKMFTSVAPEAFPYAFCKMYTDPATGFVVAQHSDGVGSKSVQRWLHWCETGDGSVFEGDADDCIEMNLGDIACAGLEPVMFTDNIAINKGCVPKDAYIKAIDKRFKELLELYDSYGMGFILAGGETADLPDQVRTYVFDGTVSARAPREKVITCEKIAPGDIIMGVRSGGKCILEQRPNSGIMSNGITLARHALMHTNYNSKYSEKIIGKAYKGRFMVNDKLTSKMTVGEALISPTRHFSIIIHKLLEKYGDHAHGVVLNTGGGQTKCTRVGKGIRYVKDELPEPDEIFSLIQGEAKERPHEMYKVFNMGIGVDVIGPPDIEKIVEEVAYEFGVDCQRTGFCEDGKGKNSLLIKLDSEELEYEAE